jgi:hypothetical protein
VRNSKSFRRKRHGWGSIYTAQIINSGSNYELLSDLAVVLDEPLLIGVPCMMVFLVVV